MFNEDAPASTTDAQLEDVSPAAVPDITFTPPSVDPASTGFDYGILTEATISVAGSNVIVSVPLARGGSNMTSVPVPLAAAWLIHLMSSPVAQEAIKHVP